MLLLAGYCWWIFLEVPMPVCCCSNSNSSCHGASLLWAVPSLSSIAYAQLCLSIRGEKGKKKKKEEGADESIERGQREGRGGEWCTLYSVERESQVLLKPSSSSLVHFCSFPFLPQPPRLYCRATAMCAVSVTINSQPTAAEEAAADGVFSSD